MPRPSRDFYTLADWPFPGSAVDNAMVDVRLDLVTRSVAQRQRIDPRALIYGHRLCLDCRQAFAVRRFLCQACGDRRRRRGKALPERLRAT